MKFLSILVPAVAVIAPALALEECSVRSTEKTKLMTITLTDFQESCISTAVAATTCLESNIECVCDSPLFLESVFECSTECGSDEDGTPLTHIQPPLPQTNTPSQPPSTPPKTTAAPSTSAPRTSPSPTARPARTASTASPSASK